MNGKIPEFMQYGLLQRGKQISSLGHQALQCLDAVIDRQYVCWCPVRVKLAENEAADLRSAN
ncbi:hypothetical protein CF165_14020 [Amycolatopsis vastitatis]|uniref:Uncharacterized protein n=1 Tax=Amycolatopsis vastitatis TaxID=1905142 RepID=A0A229TAH4_9PSEU|nr:hypothetical protein CF165_14020 [Amycolatopsis vastitatis]